jgi:hypothetical protein
MIKTKEEGNKQTKNKKLVLRWILDLIYSTSAEACFKERDMQVCREERERKKERKKEPTTNWRADLGGNVVEVVVRWFRNQSPVQQDIPQVAP